VTRRLHAPASISGAEHYDNTSRMGHRSFRDLLTFAIGFEVERNRPPLRRTLNEYVADDARQVLAKRVVGHLELSGFQSTKRGSL
jgi:hypothetical protein